MWDSKAPLQLLKNMPKKLNMENLEKLQQVLDADKYKNSLVSGFDLCGMYAPFCRDCQKTSIYPCALSYVKMLQAQGMDVQIDARPLAAPVNKPIVAEKEVETPVVVEKEEKAEEIVAEAVEAELVKEVVTETEQEIAVASAIEQEQPFTIQPEAKAEKRKIRIAVARKKII